MSRAVAFPNATTVVVGLLSTALDPIPVSARPPNPRPESGGWVVIRRVGGPQTGVVVETPTFAVEAWNADPAKDAEAETLAQTVRRAWHDMRGSWDGTTQVYGTGEFAGPAYLPDTESDCPRYTSTLTVELRGFA